MHTPEGFAELLLILLIAVGAAAVFLRLRLPAVLGYLAVGLVAGPTALGVVHDLETIRSLAELGVVLLLFSIGLEFSLPDLARMRGALLGLGGGEVLIAGAAAFGVSLLLDVLVPGAPPIGIAGGLVIAGVVAMSSTAMVTKQLTDQVELGQPHGRAALGILLFQDLAVVPFLVVISGLAVPSDDSLGWALAVALGKGVLAVAVILLVGRFVLNRALNHVAALYSGELFTLAALTVALGAAWWTAFLGLSPALGAFVAGMMLGESAFRHTMEAEIRPFRDVLLALFFVSVGMLLDFSVLPRGWPWILLLFAALVVFKFVLVFGLGRAARMPTVTAVRTGLTLAHGGEFGFALLTLGLTHELLPPAYGQVVLAALLLSMAVAPLALRFNGPLADRLLGRRAATREIEDDAHTLPSGEGRVLLVGFGRVGQHIARVLDEAGYPWSALDADPVRVENARGAGAPVAHGDGTRVDVLRAAGVDRVRAVVFTLEAPQALVNTVQALRASHPRLPILVRARDDSYLRELQEAGATEVVPETLEAGLTVSSHVLLLLGEPPASVTRRIRDLRQGRYELLRALFPGRDDSDPDALQLRAFNIAADARATGQRIDALGLEAMGVSVSAVTRDDTREDAPGGDWVLGEGDIVTLAGTAAALDRAEAALVRA
ncbi:cation:proton antiporter [Arhodomonas aquaeolei]|uniref:cation:proton antiporter domain-containing protein n=1 Tax=Arhodomonas aquaeolei TaxID=2369 RepID=UPI002166F84C|nr:cation:proton antiporter [Arhodomonas aquaeolei]MCS4504489.1 cation:proton antiporter [Arhodomonas aquaeolei]